MPLRLVHDVRESDGEALLLCEPAFKGSHIKNSVSTVPTYVYTYVVYSCIGCVYSLCLDVVECVFISACVGV